MTDEQFELASAYLDGAVSDDERARVEADPELLALVRELRAIGTAVSEPDPASADTREAAIAAALAEFDTTFGGGAEPTEIMPATPLVIPPPPSLAGVDESSVDPADALVVPMAPRRRFRLGHAISVAAAAVVVVAGGIALFRDDAEAPTNDAAQRQTIEGLSSEPDPPAAGPTTAGGVTTVTAPAADPVVTQAHEAEQPEPPAAQDAAEQPDAATEAAGNAEADSAEESEQATADAPAAPPPPNATSFNAVPPAQALPTATASDEPVGPSLTTTAPDDGVGAAAAEADTAMVAPASGGTPGTLADDRTGSEVEQQTATTGTTEPAEPPELTTREEFAEFATALGEPAITMIEAAPASSMAQYSPATTSELLTLDEATAQCDPPGTEPLQPVAVYVTEDGIAHPITVVLIGDPQSPEYGGVDIETCALVVATVDLPLVTTTTTTSTTSSPPSPAG